MNFLEIAKLASGNVKSHKVKQKNKVKSLNIIQVELNKKTDCLIFLFSDSKKVNTKDFAELIKPKVLEIYEKCLMDKKTLIFTGFLYGGAIASYFANSLSTFNCITFNNTNHKKSLGTHIYTLNSNILHTGNNLYLLRNGNIDFELSIFDKLINFFYKKIGYKAKVSDYIKRLEKYESKEKNM